MRNFVLTYTMFITCVFSVMQMQGQTYPAGQVRPPQAPGNVMLQPPDVNATSRMMQNMPPADYIIRTLQMDQQSVQSLLNPSNAEGRRFLAQQLVQRGAAPGGGQAQGVAMQQPAGDAVYTCG